MPMTPDNDAGGAPRPDAPPAAAASVERRRSGFVLGLVSMAVLTAAMPMLGALELVWRAVFFSAAVVFVAVIGFRGAAGSVVGIFVLALPLFVAPTVVDSPLIGGVAEGPVPLASRAWWATGFRLTDAVARTDLKASHVLVTPRGRRGGGGWPVTYSAAPVVPRGWTPSEPVHFWLVAQSGTLDPGDWTEASTSGIRLGQDDLRNEAIAAIARKAGLVSADSRVLIRWRADPGERVTSAWLSLGMIIGVAAIAWTVTVLVCRES